VERWKASGLTAETFARKHGVSGRSLGWWKWRLKKPARADERSRAGKKAVKSIAMPPLTFLEMTPALRSEPLEVVLVSGCRVRLHADFDAAALRRLLDVLEGRR